MATVKELLKRRCPPLPGGAWSSCRQCHIAKQWDSTRNDGKGGFNHAPHTHKPPKFKPGELERLQQLGWRTAVQS